MKNIVVLAIACACFFMFQVVVVAHEVNETDTEVAKDSENKIIIDTIIIKKMIFVSENGTTKTITLGNDGRFYFTLLGNPPVAPDE